MPNTFALGCYARYQTLFAQQVRAFNLIESMLNVGLLKASQHLLVAGGGIAGMTVTAAASACGIKVTMFEASDQLVPYQRASTRRFLHPYSYDWPFAESGDCTNFPLMNWQAGYSESVFDALESEFHNLTAADDRVLVHTNASIESVADSPTGVEVTVRRPHKTEVIKGDKLILAIGFGREFRRPDIPGYWDGDGLASTHDRTSSWLVSGYGDGALTDLARLLVKNFDHAHLFGLIYSNQQLRQSLSQLLLRSPSVRSAFDGIPPSIKSGILDKIEIRTDTSVTLCAPRGFYLEQNESSILNRFLIYLLEPHIIFQSGQLTSIPDSVKGSYKAEFSSAILGDRVPPKEYDGIMPRHGVDSVIIDGERVPRVWAPPGLKAIWDRAKSKRLAWMNLGGGASKFDDRTRVQAFDRDRFSVPPYVPLLLPQVKKSSRLRILVITSSLDPPPGVVELSDLTKDTVTGMASTIKGALGLDRHSTLEFIYDKINVEPKKNFDGWFERSVRQLCRADIVLFDITNFQPLVMTLLGIRSVLQKGISITCTYDKMDAQLWSKFPFNIKELYPVEIGEGLRAPNQRLGKVLLDALVKSRAFPEYSDLPGGQAFSRATPLDRFQRRILWDDDKAEGGAILWLCSFHEKYATSGNAAMLRSKMHATFGADVDFLRVTDIASPELVSQKLFDAIRRYEVCVIDWTQWSSNLFFEFGVRLAASPIAPICLLSDQPSPPWTPKTNSTGQLKQRFEKQEDQIRWLGRAFSVVSYEVGLDWREGELKQRVDEMRSANDSLDDLQIPPTFGCFRYDHIYALIAEELGGAKVAHKTPTDVLSEAAERLVREARGTISTLGLYSDRSAELRDASKKAALEFLVADWRYCVGELKASTLPSTEVKEKIRMQVRRITEMLRSWDDIQRKERLFAEIEREKVHYES
jgi:hypothetical protein